MKPPVLGIVIVLALLAAGAIFFASDAMAPQQVVVPEQTYANQVYGISFSYPAGYLLSEQAAGDGPYVITIIKEEDAIPRTNSEGPTAISIAIYDGPIGDGTLDGWLAANESNFALGDGTSVSSTVNGAEAVTYRWSGLYEGETTAFLHETNLVAVSVTYMSPSDEIYAAYQNLLASFRLR